MQQFPVLVEISKTEMSKAEPQLMGLDCVTTGYAGSVEVSSTRLTSDLLYIRPFHYPEDHGGVKPKEFSIYLGPKSKISEKTDQN